MENQENNINRTTAVEDIIEIIKRNNESEVKADLLIVCEEKLKKEMEQLRTAYQVGVESVLQDYFIFEAHLLKNMYERLLNTNGISADTWKNLKDEFIEHLNKI